LIQRKLILSNEKVIMLFSFTNKNNTGIYVGGYNSNLLSVFIEHKNWYYFMVLLLVIIVINVIYFRRNQSHIS